MADRGAGQWYGWDLLSGSFKFLQIASQGQWRRAAWLKSKTDPEQKSNTDFASLWRKKDRGKDKGQIYCFFLSFILIINAYIDSSFCIACVACFTSIVYTVYHIKFVLVENMKNTNHSLTIWQLEINQKDVKLWLNPLGTHIGCIAEALDWRAVWTSVAFPYRKSNFLDNKLEFSGMKLAES